MTARVHDLKHLGTNQRVARIGKAAFTGHFIKMHHPVQDFTVTAHIAQFLTQTVRRKLVIAFPQRPGRFSRCRQTTRPRGNTHGFINEFQSLPNGHSLFGCQNGKHAVHVIQMQIHNHALVGITATMRLGVVHTFPAHSRPILPARFPVRHLLVPNLTDFGYKGIQGLTQRPHRQPRPVIHRFWVLGITLIIPVGRTDDLLHYVLVPISHSPRLMIGIRQKRSGFLVYLRLVQVT